MERRQLRTPEKQEPSPRALMLAGALQGIKNDLPNRDFELDVLQEAALDDIGKGIVNGETEGYIEAFTGFGKTLLTALLAEAAVRAGLRVHVLTDSLPAADQLIGADGTRGMGRFTNLLEDGAVKQNYGGRTARPHHPVVVSTYQGLVAEAKAAEEGRGRLGQFDLILADECHKSLGTETSQALYRYMPDAIKVGFSATPDYALDRRSEEIYGRPWFEFDLRSAIEANVETGKERVAPVRPLLFGTGSTLEGRDNRPDFTERELAPLMGDMERNGSALNLAQDFVADGRQGIIACVPGEGNAHATLLAKMLSSMEAGGRKIVAQEVGGHLDKHEVRQRLEAFERGEIDILTFTRQLEQNWDSKHASFCINLAPTTSPVRTVQLLGRILRPNPDGRESVYVDFFDEKIGVTKQQYTAFHALHLEDVTVDRVLGWGASQAQDRPTRALELPPFRPELLGRLMRMQGRLLREALVSKSARAVDPLAAKWENRLAREGMPAELPYNIALKPDLERRYDKAFGTLEQELDRQPTEEEVFQEAKLSPSEQAVVRKFGKRVVASMEELDAFPNDREPIDETVERILLRDTIGKALDTLSAREEGILSMRNGIGSEAGRTAKLSEVGAVYGISPRRAGQIEASALKKLRNDPYRKLAAATDTADSQKETSWLDTKLRHLGKLWHSGTLDAYHDFLRRERARVLKELRHVTNLRDHVAAQPYPPEGRESQEAFQRATDARITDLDAHLRALSRRIEG